LSFKKEKNWQRWRGKNGSLRKGDERDLWGGQASPVVKTGKENLPKSLMGEKDVAPRQGKCLWQLTNREDGIKNREERLRPAVSSLGKGGPWGGGVTPRPAREDPSCGETLELGNQVAREGVG